MPDPATSLITQARAAGILDERTAQSILSLHLSNQKLDLVDSLEAVRQGPGRFGKFELIEKLGEGAMGEIWKARQSDLGRWVAIKFVKDPEDVERFIREAQTAARLSHPNIVGVHEAGELHGRHFITMDYIEGDDLNKRRVDGRQAVALMRDAAEAVHFAHGHGIVHRDLKPANLMMTRDGRVLVMDFGLAKSASAPGVSQSGLIVGTPRYMSPEQARGKTADARSDVYGLGATLYELVSGRPPFEDDEVYELLRKVTEEEPPPLRVERDLASIIQKAMEKDAGRRYQTARELAEDLGRHLAGEPVAARPATWTYRMQKRVRRQPLVWALAALLAAAVPAGVGFGIWQLLRVAEERRLKIDAMERQHGAERQAAAVDRALALLTEAENITYDPNVSFALIEPKANELIQVADAGLNAYPNEPRLWYYKGKGHLLMGEEEAAEAAFTRAVGLNPADGRSWYARGMIYMDRFHALVYGASNEERQAQQGEAWAWLKRAEADLMSAGVLGAEHARAAGIWSQLAEMDVVIGYEAASERIAQGGLTAEYYRMRGMLLNGEDAIRDFDAALDRHPGMWQAYLERAAENNTLSRHDEAVRDYDAVLRINPRCAYALNNRGVLYQDLGLHDRAIEDFDRAVELKRDFASAYHNRGNAYSVLARNDRAIQDYERAMDLKKEFAEPYYGRGTVYLLQGENDRAIEDFDRALAIKPGYFEAYNNRGCAYRAKGRIERAIQDFDRSLEINSDYAESYANRGRAYKTLRQYDRAIEDLDRAIRLKEDFPQAYLSRGLVYFELGEHERAIGEFDQALKFQPDCAEAYVNRGSSFHLLGQNEQAIQDFDRALEIKKDDPKAYYNRGIAYQELGQYDRAIQDYDRAVALDQNYAEAYNNRGIMYKLKGEYARAIEDYSRALKVAPPDWSYRSMVEQNIEEARELLKDQEF